MSEFLWKRNAVSVVAHSLVNIIYSVIVWSSLMVSSEKSSACMGSRPHVCIIILLMFWTMPTFWQFSYQKLLHSSVRYCPIYMIVICRLWTVASSQNHQSFESQDVLMQGRYVLNPNKGMNIHESQGVCYNHQFSA